MCTLTIISVIPDIMQHYHDVIVTAQKEVLIATNAWEPGKSVELVTTAFQELNERAGRGGRKVLNIPSSGLLKNSGSGKSSHGCCEHSECLSIQVR